MVTRASRPPRALLVDIGGILVENHWRLVARDLARRYPIPPSETESALMRLSGGFDLGDHSVAELHRRFGRATSVPVPYAEFREIVLDTGLVSISDNVESLRRLKETGRIRIVAISNMAPEVRDALDRKFHLFDLFDAAVLSSQCHVLKPDGRIYLAALQLAGVPAGESVFVDDSEANVRGAEAVGIRSVRVSGEPVQFREALDRLLLGRYGGNGEGGC